MSRERLRKSGLRQSGESDSGVGMTRSEERWQWVFFAGRPSNGTDSRADAFKSEKFWATKLPAFDVMTQGRSKDEARARVNGRARNTH